MNPTRPVNFDELHEFVARWKKRNEADTGLLVEVELNVKVYEQAKLGLEVDRV